MSNHRDWEDVVSRLDGVYTVEDFETAAYRLVAEQVIYHSDRNSRVTYAILDLYEREFAKVLAPFGVSLSINRQLRYVAALPRHAKASTAPVREFSARLFLDSKRIETLTSQLDILLSGSVEDSIRPVAQVW